MLKALELVGFKSFADRTRFAFPPGITVVVGPNGSGKSNVVDAIKWVLGEQSVKSLRGHEMADVIFNGSGTRRPLNAAEITLTLENASRRLALDTPEVAITRRVYRGGEGEYLINRTPARLRDIRELLMGTGLGTQAYSVIEQGKVDVLLQSSARDRRVIFEEAAGVSRFKAKKLEALRRLERVDQNLLRLCDIVEEVENRLKSVRAQAGKARRYKEYGDRLQELRTQVAWGDWQRLGERLAEVETALQSLAAQRDGAAAAAEAAEARALELDTASGALSESLRQSEMQMAANRERIAAQESAVEHERARLQELEAEVARHRQQLVAVSARVGDARQQLQETVEAVQAAETEHQQIAMRLVEGERALTDVTARLDCVRGEHQQRRTAGVEQMRTIAAAGNQLGALESQAAAAEAAHRRAAERTADAERQHRAAMAELEQLQRRCHELTAEAQDHDAALAEAAEALARQQTDLATRQEELADLRQRHAAARERAGLLEELERRQEGLSAGVKEVLEKARQAGDSPFREVCGLVADLLNVGVEVAPLIETALGAAAQHAVVEAGGRMREFLRGQTHTFGGRVGFVWLDEHVADRRQGLDLDLESRPGVLGRADRFVETAARFRPLAERLLGGTWIVERLDQALDLAAQAGADVSFVTLAGELLSGDGTLVVGPRPGAAGLISRRSELRALRTQILELDARMAGLRANISGLQRSIAAAQQRVHGCAARQQQTARAVGEQQVKIAAAEQRGAEWARQREALAAETQAAAAESAQAAAERAALHDRRRKLEAELAEMEAQQAALGGQIEQLEAERAARVRETTQLRVELAKSEERLRSLQSRLQQFEESRQERRRAVAESREQLGQCARRAEAARWSILQAETEIAELYLRKEAFAGGAAALVGQRDELRQERSAVAAEAQKARARARKLEEQMHEQELAANELRLQRTGVADRLREDYGVELAAIEGPATAEEQHRREEVQQEIDELRRKINALGNVNLEALEELQQLEGRHKTLAGQYQDLASAKASLEKIIHRINADSRRLFAETLETVRGHFQTLFRDLFGGGHADIVLEDGVDILDSGIEIVARPPGKEPRSISLLSGGEKTLTCVAMLLAIFRSRPSPFCVLDEVDAALDEANIDRFIKVLRDFLTWTQFIIVTHSKRTMTCADTIYGVTMQESGVSKQVSVRFEDVSDNGEISPERLAAEAEPPAASEAA